MEQDVITKLVDFLENAAPSLWEAAMSRAFAQALLTGLAAVVFLVVSVVLFALVKASYYKARALGGDRDDGILTAFAVGAAGFLTALFGLTLAHDLVMYISAPELNAIGVLFGLVK